MWPRHSLVTNRGAARRRGAVGVVIATAGAPGRTGRAGRAVRPVLIAICGLPFSGSRCWPGSLGQAPGIRVLPYDFEVCPVFRHLVPAGSPSRRGMTSSGTSPAVRPGKASPPAPADLRRPAARAGRPGKLAAVASARHAKLLLVCLDTPLKVIAARRTRGHGCGPASPAPSWRSCLPLAGPGRRRRAQPRIRSGQRASMSGKGAVNAT